MKGRKRAAIGSAVAVLLGAVAAFAYFTATGSGTGSAQTGSAADVTITQVGAGYDSLVTTSNTNANYFQDQCFDCASISQFGNAITLANPGYQRLVSAVVAFRNWGAAVSGVPITLEIVGGGPTRTVTQNVNLPASQPNGRPTTFNVRFPFTSHPYVSQQLVYRISFPTSYNHVPAAAPVADSLNVALSDSFTQLSVGQDTNPGTVYVTTSLGAGIGGDFPSCTVPTGNTWQQVPVNCGPSAPGNPGAYGNFGGVTTNADIPAVEFNVMGGVASPLYPGAPGQPVDLAITNPGGGSVHIDTLTFQIGNGAGGSATNKGSCNTDIVNAGAPWWYQLTPNTDGAGLIEADTNGGSGWNVPPGTTIVSPTGVSIKMIDSGTSQDHCQNALVHLKFTAS